MHANQLPDAPAPQSPHGPSRAARWWNSWTLQILASALMVAGLAWYGAHSVRASAFESSRALNERLVLSDEIRIRHTLGSIDTLLQVVRQDYRANPRAALEALDDRLQALLLDAGLHAHLSIFDAQGRLLASTASKEPQRIAGVSIQDRDFFRELRDGTADRPLVGTSLKGKFDGRTILPIARRIDGPDGRLQAIVVIAINPAALAALDTRTPLDDHAVRALLNLQGQVIVRQVGTRLEFQGDASGSQLFAQLALHKAGGFDSVSPIDGVSRLLSYRLVEPYGLISVASISEDSIAAATRAQVLRSATWCAAFGLLLAVSWAAMRWSGMQRRAVQSHLDSLAARELFLLEQVPTSLLLAWNVGGEIVVFQCNQRLLHMLGCSREELVGRPINALLQVGANRRPMQDWVAVLERQPRARTQVMTVVAPSGRELPVMAELSVVRNFSHPDDEGRPVLAYCITLLDISAAEELKAALLHKEQRFKRLMDVLPEQILTFDAAGRLRWANQNARAYLGLDAVREPIVLDRLDAFVHPQDLAGIHAARERLLASPQQPQKVEARLRGTDGGWCWFETRIVALLDENGQLSETICASTDIDERKDMEERAVNTQRLVTTGQLASGLAHDFNNLLAISIGNLDMVCNGRPEPRLQQQLGVAMGAAERGARLVKSMLALAGKQVLNPTVVDLNAVLESMLPLVYQALAMHAKLELQYWPEPLWVKVDMPRLESSILNLVVNARDAMPAGGVLQIGVRQLPPRDGGRTAGTARLSITDSGVGMSEEVKRRALEPFFTTKEAGRGTGLGLSMVAGFVHQSGGELHIDSTVQMGTTIHIELPLSPAAPVVMAVAPARIQPAVLSGRALVVDDEEDLANLVAGWLDRAGFAVQKTGTVQQAMRLLQKEAVDLVVSDIVTPGTLNGFDLLEFIHDLMPDTKVLLMSGYSKDAIAMARRPEAPLLTKPFRQSDLLAAVQGLVDMPDPASQSRAAA